MTDIKELRANYNAMVKQKRALSNAIDIAISEMQSQCPHPLEQIREAEYVRSTGWSDAQAPFRVCVDCGLAEEGWGRGYESLAPNVHSDIPSITREHGRRLMIGPMRLQKRG